MIKFIGKHTIKGKLTKLLNKDDSLNTSEEREYAYEVYAGSLFKFWFRVSPGVTGYESVEFNPDINSNLKQRGWCACAGTYLSWDRLEFSAEQMKLAIEDIETQYREELNKR